MAWFGGIVAGEGATAARVAFGAFLGEESQVSVAGGFEFTVRPVIGFILIYFERYLD